jgi:hypothetical protein
VAGPDGPMGGDAALPMGSTVLHRLSNTELRNVLQDTLGAEASARAPKPDDVIPRVVDTIAEDLTVSASAVDSMFETAKIISLGLSAQTLPTCAAGASERACAEQQIESLGLRLLRRPVSGAELADFLKLWDDVKSREDALTATRAIAQRLLLSPDFLYHVELGDERTGRLDAYETASRLSFALWETAPDAALYESAKSGKLLSSAGIQAEVERMLSSPQTTATLRRFFGLWSDIGKLETAVKDPQVYPDFEALRKPMREEFTRFIDSLLTSNKTVADLLTSRQSFINDELAQFYGVTKPATAFAAVDLGASRAGGFLTQGAFLAVHGKAQRSGPILRGLFVLERMLCSPINPPPPDLDLSERPDTVKDRTTREYFHTLTSASQCQGCHSAINPLGFAFEAFDGIGRQRSSEKGFPIDTRVTLSEFGAVSDASELTGQLGRSEQVQQCLIRWWFRSRFRRQESQGDEAVIEAMSKSLDQDGRRLSSLASVLTRQESFFYRHFRLPESP